MDNNFFSIDNLKVILSSLKPAFSFLKGLFSNKYVTHLLTFGLGIGIAELMHYCREKKILKIGSDLEEQKIREAKKREIIEFFLSPLSEAIDRIREENFTHESIKKFEDFLASCSPKYYTYCPEDLKKCIQDFRSSVYNKRVWGLLRKAIDAAISNFRVKL